MAIIDARQNNDDSNGSGLGLLGGLAMLGGGFIPGASFLTPFGLGLNALSAYSQGKSKEANGLFNKIKSGEWKKSKNDKAQATVTPTVAQPTDADLAKKWGAGATMTYNLGW